MAEEGCSTEQCTYTGSQTASDATPGRCTNQAGYIANAEIQEILNDPSRVTSSYVDQGSDSNILVYDNIQWVGYMDDGIKASRKAMYQELGFGGTTDWATDLAQFNPPPDDYETWELFISSIQGGHNPEKDATVTRSGEWVSITCNAPAVQSPLYMTPSDRWSQLDAGTAWQNCKDQWTNNDSKDYWITFTQSFSNLLHENEGANCGSMADTNNCGGITTVCATTADTGAAAYEVYNSLVIVHEVSKNAFIFSLPYLSLGLMKFTEANKTL
jgi:hypothetical protein